MLFKSWLKNIYTVRSMFCTVEMLIIVAIVVFPFDMAAAQKRQLEPENFLKRQKPFQRKSNEERAKLSSVRDDEFKKKPSVKPLLLDQYEEEVDTDGLILSCILPEREPVVAKFNSRDCNQQLIKMGKETRRYVSEIIRTAYSSGLDQFSRDPLVKACAEKSNVFTTYLADRHALPKYFFNKRNDYLYFTVTSLIDSAKKVHDLYHHSSQKEEIAIILNSEQYPVLVAQKDRYLSIAFQECDTTK